MSAGRGLNQVFRAVKAFHGFGKHPIGQNPVAMYKNQYSSRIAEDIRFLSERIKMSHQYKFGVPRLVLRVSWFLEEIAELLEAETLRDQIDALLDLLYFVVGTFVEIGFYPGKSFDAVHAANMRKEPAESGQKVTKPDGWIGPENEIEQEIQRQQEEMLCQ